MKIRKLQLKNIGVFDDETIEFKPCPAKDKAEIHIFTGQNGSGKTTLLQALTSAFEYLPNFHKERNAQLNYLKLLKLIAQSVDKSNIKSRDDEIAVSAIGELAEVFKDRIYEPINEIRNQKFYKKFRFFDSQDNNEAKSFVIAFGDDLTPISSVYGCKICSNIHSEKIEPLEIYSKLTSEKTHSVIKDFEFPFSFFAYSGYRGIEEEKIEFEQKIEENPLYQALEFLKKNSSQFTVNQWLGRNLSRRALAVEAKNKKNKIRFDENIKNLEHIISEIVGYEIKFQLKSDLSLVLIKDNKELDIDVLPDGLKSLISWIGDLLSRLDLLKWENDTPIFDREIILFLDEVEVHLHPAWQRKVLPVVQKLFKNAQIFVSTHSPFVVNSVDDAWVYKLKLDEKGKAKVESVERSEDARSYRYVLRNTFDIENEFGIEIENRLKDFYKERDAILAENGNSKKAKAELKKIAKELSKQSKELKTKIDFELFQLSEITGEDF